MSTATTTPTARDDAAPDAPAISFAGVTKDFPTPGGAVRAVDDVTLDIAPGEVFGVIGYSGAGKSTLVRLVNALEPATSGSVRVHGREITGLRETELRRVRAGIGMIFQQFNLLSSRTVAGNVAYPLAVAKWSRDDRRARVAELLDFVGLADKARAYPSQLSGGQKQRVGIARALAARPRILLADEATSALDPETTQDVLDLLRRVNRELGVTVVVITHEMEVVKYLCDRVAVMEHGKVVEHGDVYSVFARPQHPATRRFVGTSLRDRPSPSALERLRHRHPGRIVTVAVREDGASSTDLTRALREHPVDGTIVYGGITEIAERPYGSLTLELAGADDAIEAFLADLARSTTVLDLGTAAAPLTDPDAVGPRATGGAR
ncbi:methionine ABC transporter ATP-binding protein [Actinotalea fermentans]|uniref:Methionine import ATP-binding protein MetN n=1 Tax=Actinotalea fermentans TaxID=43671 RepID=A0A511Z0V4_9CELL|nr:ATP-binding cassette domain-containing protein [Actinotalea fermentans]KGM16947.1 methionine ABC transporter ATP-binding protein [Actinotalea fermentans ATCC 43279 = JCM 9966 = DSM 3133]GEN81063.1 methionine import ATP-binding protein MetN [Actinotalea fermentans]